MLPVQTLDTLPFVPFVFFGIAVAASLLISKRRWIIHAFAILPVLLVFPVYYIIGASILDIDNANAGELAGFGLLFTLYVSSALLAAIGFEILYFCLVHSWKTARHQSKLR